MLRNVTHHGVRPFMPSANYCSPESGMPKSTALVRRDVIGLVALDFVLGIILRRVMRMALVVEVEGMNLDDRPRHPPRFGIPAHVITDFELREHFTISSFEHVGTLHRHLLIAPNDSHPQMIYCNLRYGGRRHHLHYTHKNVFRILRAIDSFNYCHDVFAINHRNLMICCVSNVTN